MGSHEQRKASYFANPGKPREILRFRFPQPSVEAPVVQHDCVHDVDADVDESRNVVSRLKSNKSRKGPKKLDTCLEQVWPKPGITPEKSGNKSGDREEQVWNSRNSLETDSTSLEQVWNEFGPRPETGRKYLAKALTKCRRGSQEVWQSPETVLKSLDKLQNCVNFFLAFP